MNVIVVIVLWGLFVVGATLISGLIWMLGLGVLAQIFHNHDLAISYGQSVIVALFANMILGIVKVRWNKN